MQRRSRCTWEKSKKSPQVVKRAGEATSRPWCGGLRLLGLLSGSGEQRFEPFGRTLLHARDDVGVGVYRELYAAVAEPLLHELGMNPVGHQQHGVAMPQVVQPDSRQPCPAQQLPEGTVRKVLRLDDAAHRRGEDQSLILILLAPSAASTWPA